MHYKKFISLFALLALMLGQVAVAQHSAAHVDHGFIVQISSAHDDCNKSSHEDKESQHNCPECALQKTLQVALYHTPTVFIAPNETESLTLYSTSFKLIKHLRETNAPRAPPVIFI